MKTLSHLNLRSPAKINEQIRRLILVLGLDDQQVRPLAHTAPACFVPAVRQCHWNTWQQMHLRGGGIQPGWMLFQDPVASVAEAIFHSVWISPDGQLQDITPREDQEELVQFITDPTRTITLSSHGNRPAIFTYANVQLHGVTVVSQPRRHKAVLMDGYVESIGLFPWPGT